MAFITPYEKENKIPEGKWSRQRLNKRDCILEWASILGHVPNLKTLAPDQAQVLGHLTCDDLLLTLFSPESLYSRASKGTFWLTDCEIINWCLSNVRVVSYLKTYWQENIKKDWSLHTSEPPGPSETAFINPTPFPFPLGLTSPSCQLSVVNSVCFLSFDFGVYFYHIEIQEPGLWGSSNTSIKMCTSLQYKDVILQNWHFKENMSRLVMKNNPYIVKNNQLKSCHFLPKEKWFSWNFSNDGTNHFQILPEYRKW